MEENMHMEQDMRRDDLFSGAEASEIAAENAGGAPQPSALERAAQRIAAVQERRAGAGGWDQLFARYPETRSGQIGADVLAGVRSGMTPTEAYQQVRLRAMQAENTARQSAQRAVGSLAGDGGPQSTDPFLSGFNHKN